MGLRFASLGSGSSGNGLVVDDILALLVSARSEDGEHGIITHDPPLVTDAHDDLATEDPNDLVADV